jgi:hypothetical protein
MNCTYLRKKEEKTALVWEVLSGFKVALTEEL